MPDIEGEAVAYFGTAEVSVAVNRRQGEERGDERATLNEATLAAVCEGKTVPMLGKDMSEVLYGATSRGVRKQEKRERR